MKDTSPDNTAAKSAGTVVIFEVPPRIEGVNEYLELGAALQSELRKTPGFIRAERFSSLSEEGKLLSVSFWENEKAAAAWRNRPAHRNCQKKGGETLFERYSITVASVVRGYTRDERAQAPQYSEKALRRK